ncbi:MAG: hypothetical protein IPJ19_06235 [Planctomycetes bacterium]|nr:hypothetical protein [Planctomycetota bacterium]
MPSRRFTYLWVQDGIPARRFLDERSAPLEERLAALARDEGRAVEALVLDAAHAVFGWALEHDAAWQAPIAGAEFELGVEEFEARQGWRGMTAIFLDSLRLAWGRCAQGASLLPRSALSEEAGMWIWSQREDLESWPDLAGAWNGEALAAGRRSASRAEHGRAAAAELENDETILVHGFSEALARALEEAQRAGKRPRILCGEGLPLLEGRRLARRLAPLELPITLAYDAQIADLVLEADRVWIASEAVGARALVAQAGARRIAREALEHDVPLQVLASSDALLPGGRLELPEWMAHERSLLWVEAPRTVELRTSFLEELPLEDVPGFLTEAGAENAEELFLRALRLERAPLCAPRSEPHAVAALRESAPGTAPEHGVLRPSARAAAHTRHDEDQRTHSTS